MYYVRVHELAQGVLHFVRREGLLKAGDRVAVAVSGGADSVALLCLLREMRKHLGVVLSVIHFNHQLRGAESDADEQFVCGLARRWKLEFHGGSGPVKAYAAEKHMGVESAGRELRYKFFRQAGKQGLVDHVATAHTLDDQAETVLLRLVRGAGTRGLAGIYPKLRPLARGPVASKSEERSEAPSIVRPLLHTRRVELEKYLKEIDQAWREDASNRDLRHARNRMRHGILPRLERNFNPEVRRTLAEAAEIARGEEDYWRMEVERLLLPMVDESPATAKKLALKIGPLGIQSLAVRRRLVRAAAERVELRLEFRQVEEILELASAEGNASKRTTLGSGWELLREDRCIVFSPLAPSTGKDYEYSLPVPGRVDVPEAGLIVEAVPVTGYGGVPGYNSDTLYDPTLLATHLRVRNWRPGDRFWPAHTKAPAKVKELLQRRHVSGPTRESWPVVVSGDEIVWVRGFCAPSRVRPRGNRAVAIREVPMDETRGQDATL